MFTTWLVHPLVIPFHHARIFHPSCASYRRSPRKVKSDPRNDHARGQHHVTCFFIFLLRTPTSSPRTRPRAQACSSTINHLTVLRYLLSAYTWLVVPIGYLPSDPPSQLMDIRSTLSYHIFTHYHRRRRNAAGGSGKLSPDQPLRYVNLATRSTPISLFQCVQYLYGVLG